MEKLGGDSIEEMQPRFAALRRNRLEDLPMDNCASGVSGTMYETLRLNIVITGFHGGGQDQRSGRFWRASSSASLSIWTSVIESRAGMTIPEIFERQW